MTNVLSYAAIMGLWISAGGPANVASTAAAITGCESSFNAQSVQAGQPYATTGWGLWQITPGDSVPSVGINQALLDPLTNAKAAVAKYKAAGNTFRPWTTYENGCYRRYLSGAATPDMAGAASASAGSSATDAASTSSTASSSNPECLWGFPIPNVTGFLANTLSLGTANASQANELCILSYAEAQALVGAALMVGSFVTFTVGMTLLTLFTVGQKAAPVVANAVGAGVAGKATGRALSNPVAATATAVVPSRVSASRVPSPGPVRAAATRTPRKRTPSPLPSKNIAITRGDHTARRGGTVESS
jgi:Lysozyme like domain